MAATLVRSCMQFSPFRQPLIDIIRREQTTNCILQTFGITCVQCQCYHVTSMYLKQRKTREQKKIARLQRAESIIAPLKPMTKKELPTIKVWRDITVMELAQSAQRDVGDVLEAISLTDKEKLYTENSILMNFSAVHNAVRKLGGKPFNITRPNQQIEKEKDYDVVKRPPPKESDLKRRHPVVTIMGHVDHGKTTLLDALRNSSVVETEFGGITQHIGAFNVSLKSGERVTFLDTPGHAAFSAMRARGAQATDIVVLVVAADDGVMEQTIQSIEMAKDANVPIIVAINKIDKPGADIDRALNMLAQQGILVEQLGGDVQSINISALKSTNLETLTEAIVLQAELMDLKGDPTGLVEGIVIECANEVGRGKLATALIQRGTLKRGSVLVAGMAWAKVRSMFNDAGEPVLEAKPAEAVQIIGWRALPNAGDEIIEVENDKRAHMIMRYREAQSGMVRAYEHKEAANKKHEEHLIEYKKNLELKRTINRYRKVIEPRVAQVDPLADFPKVNLIIKGDVVGSVEAILDVLDTYNEDDRCRLNIVHYGIGATAETDVELAQIFKATIYNFNVIVPPKLQQLIDNKGISVKMHKIIYKLVDDIREEINNQLPEQDVEEVIGEANVLQEFEVTEGKKKVKVAGCRCVQGVLKKNATYHLVRQNETIYTGSLVSMRHKKDEVQSIKLESECGLRLDDPTISFKAGDTLICFNILKQPQKTGWNPGF